MDARYSSYNGKVEIPLYPQLSKINFSFSYKYYVHLQKKLCTILGCQRDNLLISNSASNALYSYLKQLKKDKEIKIALPAYSCLSLVQAIISSDCTPVFIDLTQDLSLSKETIDFVVKQRCEFIIWPDFFGPRIKNDALLDVLTSNNVKIIFDEAQAFPFKYTYIKKQVDKYAFAVLVSFGNSKPIAGIGGGVLYLTQSDNKFNFLKQNPSKNISLYLKNLLCMKMAVMQYAVWKYPFIMNRLNMKNSRFSRQDQALELRSGYHYSQFKPISLIECKIICKNFELINANEEKFQSMYLKLAALYSKYLGKSAGAYLRSIVGVPSIIGLKVDPKNRYKLLDIFSSLGIQTTWYYYPLDKLSKFMNYPKENLDNTMSIAESVIILPFQWQHAIYDECTYFEKIEMCLRLSI